MFSVRLSSRLLALFSFAFYVPSATGLGQQPIQIKFRTAAQSMIIVPVTINGVGPFDFALDTGSTSSMVDRKLAEQLHLPLIGKTIVETAQGQAPTLLVHANSVRMADADTIGLDLFVLDHYAASLPKVRGILGEDFLVHFDVYIDYRHHLIQLESGSGRLGEMLVGEHLPLSSYGSRGEKLDSDRLVIVGHFDEIGNKDAKLQLDSGVPYLVLCSQGSRPGILNEPQTFPVTGLLGSSFAAYSQTAHLRVGRFFSDVTVIVPAQNIHPLSVDGFLPTSLFRTIFISHSGRFVILNPTAKPALAQSKPPSRIDTEITDADTLRTE